MNREANGAIGEIVGAIAVLVTLIYLASQIRIQNRQARDASTQWGVSQFNTLRLATLQNPVAATGMMHGYQSVDELDSVQRLRFFNAIDFVVATLWAQFQSVQNGTSDLTLNKLRAAFSNMRDSKPVRDIWSTRLRDRYPEDFREFIDSALSWGDA